jgi:hypothetical protein
MSKFLTHDCKFIEVPTNKGTFVDLIVDADFDETALSGLVFEELYNSIAVYKRGSKYRTNHTKIGSMNEVFGFPRCSRRFGKKFHNDYTSTAWLKNNIWQYNFVLDTDIEGNEPSEYTSWLNSFVNWLAKFVS